MSACKAQGQARHRFWGKYSALIALSFDDEQQAAEAHAVLGDRWRVPGNASTVPNLRRCLLYAGSDPELKTTVATLESYGAKGVLSLAHSVDFGEPFTVTIPTRENDR